MKTLIQIIFLTISLISFVNAQEPNENYFDNDKLNLAWENFMSSPNEENAMIVSSCLPKNGHVKKENMNLELQETIYQNLPILENEIIKGRQNSMTLGFRLLTISDGAFSEEIYIMLGNSINTHPKLLLSTLQQNSDLVSLRHLLCNYGADYWDNKSKTLTETENRIEMLKKVEQENLINIRNQCISELNIFLNEINN